METTTENTALPAEDSAEMARQLAAIREMDPKAESLSDILKLDTAEAFRGYVRRGLDWKDAFLLANRERLLSDAEERASLRRQKAGKAHLQPDRARGEGAVSVPAPELHFYRELLPGLSEAEYRKHYNAERKHIRG